MNKFNIGDWVWIAESGSTQKYKICPDCMGKLYLTVILGDNSQVTIPCATCAPGIEPPTGKVSYYEWDASVRTAIVRKIEIEAGKPVEYYLDQCGYAKEYNVFATKEDAEIRAKELQKQHNEEEAKKVYQKDKNNHTWAWHVRYHREQIKRAQYELEYHTAKLQAAKTKTKEVADGE